MNTRFAIALVLVSLSACGGGDFEPEEPAKPTDCVAWIKAHPRPNGAGVIAADVGVWFATVPHECRGQI
jgi:hypothetical protein